MIKKLSLILVLVLSKFALAADSQGSIVVINLERIKSETKAGQSINQQLETLQKNFNDKVGKLTKDIEARKQELDKQKTMLSKEAFAKKEAEFNTKFTETRKQLQNEDQKLQLMVQGGMIELNQIANSVIDEMVKSGKYSHIMSRELMIYIDPKFDITDQVISEIDKKATKITLKEQAPEKK